MILNANRKRVLGGGGAGYTSISVTETDTYDYSLDGGIVNARGFYFKPDELSMWLIEYGGGDDVFRYDFGTPADLTTVSYIEFKNGQLSTPTAMCYGNAGAYYYVYNTGDDKIYRLTTGSAYDNTTLTASQSSLALGNGETNSLIISDDGLTMWGTSIVSSGGIYTWALGTAWDVTSITETATSIGGLFVEAFCFFQNGEYIIVLDSSNALGLYKLSVAYDVTTVGSVIDTEIFTAGVHNDIYVTNADDKLFYLDYDNKLIRQYTLTIS